MCVVGCDQRPSGADAGAGTTVPCRNQTAVARFIDDGGNPAVPSASVKTALEISNRVTTRDLPNGFGDPSSDRDNFKIEVFDASVTDDTIPKKKVTLEAFKPNGSAFSPPRRLSVELKRVGTTNVFRSKYLRLVVDDKDQEAKPEQTLLVDWDENDPTVEILGQRVGVKYAASSGDVWSYVNVGGPNRSSIKMAVHILRGTPGGAPAVTVAAARKRIRKWFRRSYAQISMAPHLLLVREIDPPENLISISNDTGANAAGGGRISFRIRARRPGAPDVVQDVGPYNPGAGDSPAQTANALSGLIQVARNFNVRVVQNPPTLEAAITQGSADLIISDPGGGRIIIENLNATDPAQTVSVGVVNGSNIQGWAEGGRRNWVAGSLQQRTVLQNFDTGDDRIDLVVAGAISTGDRGQAMIPGTIYAAGKQAISRIIRSAFHSARTMDDSDNHPFSGPHEVGHDLLDAIHVTGDTSQLMRSGTSASNDVNGSKRISESAATFDDPAQNIVQETRMRSVGAPALGVFPPPA